MMNARRLLPRPLPRKALFELTATHKAREQCSHHLCRSRPDVDRRSRLGLLLLLRARHRRICECKKKPSPLDIFLFSLSLAVYCYTHERALVSPSLFSGSSPRFRRRRLHIRRPRQSRHRISAAVGSPSRARRCRRCRCASFPLLLPPRPLLSPPLIPLILPLRRRRRHRGRRGFFASRR